MKRQTLQLLAIIVAAIVVVTVTMIIIKQQEIFPTSTLIVPPLIITPETQLKTRSGNENSLAMLSLSENILNSSRQSEISATYKEEAEKFVYSLVAHLGDFQLPTLGITEQSMNEALRQNDAGTRINAAVNEVWVDWLGIGKERGLDVWTTEPNDYGLSPFRQLVVKLIQDKQGQLIDSQQHALFNFFTRPEKQEAWVNGIDGVIGAVNRESFRWP